MDANVTPQVEVEEFEAMTVYFDKAGEELYTGQHLNEIAAHDPFDVSSSLTVMREFCRPATPEETLAYWAAVAIQVEAERLDFESRMREMTGHHIDVNLRIYPHYVRDYSIYDASKSAVGFGQDGHKETVWTYSNDQLKGHTTIFGPALSEQTE